MKTYTVGVDFGSLSARAVLADTASGRVLASETMAYPHAVMDTVLAATGERLPPDYALQDPADYLLCLETILPLVIKAAGVTAKEVVGVGVDFTTCSMLPVDENGTPLCFQERFRGEKQAYVKMWKHHAAGPYADRINEVARARGERWLDLTGGAVSSEFMFPKIYQTLVEAPLVYQAAAAFMEAGDFIVRTLTGVPYASYQYAAYKCQYGEGAYPSEDFFAAVDEKLRHVVRDKLPFPLKKPGEAVGKVTAAAAARFGLAEGTVVAAATADAHVAAFSLDTCRSGDAYAVFGTSAPFFVLGEKLLPIEGVFGVAEDGVVPGTVGYEAGLCCFGDHFAYAADRLTSPLYVKEAEARGISMLRLLIEKASKKKPGESGVLALNWFNGNRSVLSDSALSGLFVGVTLATAPEDLMRALIEATAFATRNIFETLKRGGVPVTQLVAAGGVARKDPFTMGLFADVLGLPIRIAATTEAPALGSAVNAAVAAGIYPSFAEAIPAMSQVSDTVYRPNEANRAVYDSLYAEYMRLHDYFGRGENGVMHRLRDIKKQAIRER